MGSPAGRRHPRPLQRFVQARGMARVDAVFGWATAWATPPRPWNRPAQLGSGLRPTATAHMQHRFRWTHRHVAVVGICTRGIKALANTVVSPCGAVVVVLSCVFEALGKPSRRGHLLSPCSLTASDRLRTSYALTRWTAAGRLLHEVQAALRLDLRGRQDFADPNGPIVQAKTRLRRYSPTVGVPWAAAMCTARYSTPPHTALGHSVNQLREVHAPIGGLVPDMRSTKASRRFVPAANRDHHGQPSAKSALASLRTASRTTRWPSHGCLDATAQHRPTLGTGSPKRVCHSINSIQSWRSGKRHRAGKPKP